MGPAAIRDSKSQSRESVPGGSEQDNPRCRVLPPAQGYWRQICKEVDTCSWKPYTGRFRVVFMQGQGEEEGSPGKACVIEGLLA
jgi:hypothetical protein